MCIVRPQYRYITISGHAYARLRYLRKWLCWAAVTVAGIYVTQRRGSYRSVSGYLQTALFLR
jgi:hypothetical protein